MYYTISQAAELLGVHAQTIRKWDKEGKIKCIRTAGGHRRIHRDEVMRIIEGKKRRYKKRKRGVAVYGRVSAYDQKKNGDLDRQMDVMREYCRKENLRVEAEVTDMGSGLKTSRRGLKKLYKLVCKGKISKVIISYKDRLTRFGFEYLEYFFNSYGVEIVVLNRRKEVSVQQEMIDDLIALVTSFSGKMHGMRSWKNKKKLDANRSGIQA